MADEDLTPEQMRAQFVAQLATLPQQLSYGGHVPSVTIAHYVQQWQKRYREATGAELPKAEMRVLIEQALPGAFPNG